MSDTEQGERRARLRGALVRAGREEEAPPALRASLLANATGADDTSRRSRGRAAASVSWKVYAMLAFAAGTAGGTLGVALPTMLVSTRAPAPSAIGDEMILVDRARSAAYAGNDSEVLRLLDEHDARFPSGVLAEEAIVLRIESHARLGRPDVAAQLAKTFLDTHPTSPHALRVRNALTRFPVSIQESKPLP